MIVRFGQAASQNAVLVLFAKNIHHCVDGRSHHSAGSRNPKFTGMLAGHSLGVRTGVCLDC
jgi:hypothetical protein